MRIPVRNLKNEEVRQIELPDSVFGYPFNAHLIHLAVQAVLAASRAGTHRTKRRSEVSGSGKKLWKQKGTGRARMGSIRSPLWRKGGTVHGPKPRSYEKDLAPREKRNALKAALSRKLAEDRLVVVESLDLESHKTRELIATLGKLGLDRKALLVDQHGNERLALASRNISRIKAVDALGVNVYDVVDRGHLVISERALNRLLEVLEQ